LTGGIEKTTNTPVGIADVRTEIWTRNLLSRKQEC
jgi:hypothetical protein